jgi:alkylation response protein AidB-like acyl-CoA dehydrogenase
MHFHRDVIAPLNQPGDAQGCQFDNGRVTTPDGSREAYRAFCDGGWMALGAPEAIGGMGLPYLVNIAAGEINIGANCGMAIGIGLTAAAVEVLVAFGTEQQKRLYLDQLVSGAWQGTMCLTEPQAGSAVGDLKTMATPDGAEWLLKGTKIFISAGDHDLTENHVHLVLARTPGAPDGFKGISLFLVPKYLPNADGSAGAFNDVHCTGVEHKMGIKSSPTCTLSFGEDGRCRGQLIGELGSGLFQMFRMMNHARIGVGLQGVALAAQAYNYARLYAMERVQGVAVEALRDPLAPRVTIDNHPNVRRMLLWSKAMVEGMRALLYRAAYYGDVVHHSADKQGGEKAHALLEIMTPIVKAYCSDMGFDVTRTCMQVLGGYGYCSEYPVEQIMRDVKIASIYEGTNCIQALDLLGRKLAAKQGLYFRTLCTEIQKLVYQHKDHAELASEFRVLGQELQRWQGLTMELAMIGMQGDQRYPVMIANPFLRMAGNLIVAWLLLEQAVVAEQALAQLQQSRNALSDTERRALARDDAEGRFYANKRHTARFFIYQILSENQGIAAQIQSKDRSALDYAV